MKYWYTKKVTLSFEEALSKVIELLWKEWFWVIFNMDVQAKMKEKLNKDLWKYNIIWVCNPWLAYEAIQSEIEIGLLLPCNVIVYEKDFEVYISTIVPSSLLPIIWNKDLKIINEAEIILKKIIDVI